MSITEELIAQIHAAMEKAQGSATVAAELLGMDRRKLYDFIHNNPELKIRWGTSKKEAQAPTEEVLIHRPILPVPSMDERIAKAVEGEDALIRSGLENMGITGRTLDMALALQQFNSRHFRSAIEMINGGVTKHFLDISVAIEAIDAELAGGVDPEREKVLREDRSRLYELGGKCSDRMHQAAMIRAKIQAMQAAREGGARKNSKPGFSPIVAVHGQNVTIQEK